LLVPQASTSGGHGCGRRGTKPKFFFRGLNLMICCLYCTEPIQPGQILNGQTHIECLYRSVGGSVAHLSKRCSCYVAGSIEGDPKGYTLRQGSIAAWWFNIGSREPAGGTAVTAAAPNPKDLKGAE
jgi:hypothetical protein